MDALTEGAYPVYAVAAEATEVVDEDVGTETGTLANAPVSEDADEVTFEVDGSAQETVVVFSDPSAVSLDAGQTAYNPTTGDYAHDAAPTSGNATYSHYDYSSAVSVVETERAEVIDFIGVLTETDAVATAAHETALRMEQNGHFAVAVAGAASHVPDAAAYTNPFDSSRIQLLYPSRNAEGQSIIGAYLGLRAMLGINNSPMFKRLQTQNRLSETLAKDVQETLVNEKVVPAANDSRGARIVEDLTCVDDSNTEEDAMRQVLHRLIVDYVTEVTNEVSEKFIGELHTQAARNALRSSIVSRLGGLMDMNAITAFVVTVQPVDSMTASVDVGVDTIDPLRNINATVTAGAVA
ncbi:hypothetical protein [Halospeciosus flavus]|uniref:Phage tail sheath protein n=1 Tax=Halospeciosus flavus TaxID=3032283 RepID=A0ABD5Z303_9EURY|nr:hypothetical protein [Halospeciosus flavus]